MPRLSPNFSQAVFFLFGRHPRTNKLVGPHGSGFFVAIPRAGQHVATHVYAVTCWHVAPQGSSIIRVNLKAGGSRLIELEPHEWQFVGGGDDIAAVDVTDHLDDVGDQVAAFPQSFFATREFIDKVKLGVGEDGFMLGLFARHAGKTRNMVAARFGNVSLLADDQEPIEQPNRIVRPSHLFDMHSRPGFSGSPVFVYRTPAGDLRNIAFGPRQRRSSNPPPSPRRGVRDEAYPQVMADYIRENHRRQSQADHHEWMIENDFGRNVFLRILGIHTGQYNEPTPIIKVAKERPGAAEADDTLKEGDRLQLQSSMTIVAPSWEVLNLLQSPFFDAQRKAREMSDAEKAASEPSPVPESASAAEDDSGAEEAGPVENESHREDFTRLVGAASKKQKPAR